MKVLLLSKYPRMGASSRLRSFQHIPYLESIGISVEVQSLFDESYLNDLYQSGARSRFHVLRRYLKRLGSLLFVSKYDVVWIEKEVFPYLPALIERLFSFFGKPYVVDFDDAIFHSYDMSNSGLMRRLLGKKIDVVMENSACVIAGNDYLANRAKGAGAKRIELIPTVVDHKRYSASYCEAEKSPLVIGWIGSPSTQQYVVEIAPAIQKVCEQNAAKLMMVGATMDVEKSLSGIDIEVLPWSEDTEVELIRRMDVGIMPLRDGPWERGKCGYKLIQYMASMVPVVASPVGVNDEIVEKNECGFLADSISEWEFRLNQILGMPDAKAIFGKNGRMAVEEKYSTEVQGPNLAAILRSVSLG